MILSLSMTGRSFRGGNIRRMGKCIFHNEYEDIISLENLLLAWREFKKGKKNRLDVQLFERDLMSNIISLHIDLKNMNYIHSNYEAFNISDSKPRNIHKASVKDRLLHHALYRKLYPFFNNTFIADSYSCRLGKGTHKVLSRLFYFSRKASKNNTKTVWVLKCDIRKFFASINQNILIRILDERIEDKRIMWILEKIIRSFDSGRIDKGLPLGNLTSQLLVNIYMNEFDQYVKHKLRVKYYIRYADDFVFLSEDKNELVDLLFRVKDFLLNKLKLSLHSDKVFIKTLASGIDFLGWVHFPNYRVLRTMTKRRMFRNMRDKGYNQETIQSYLGLLNQGNGWKMREKIEKIIRV